MRRREAPYRVVGHTRSQANGGVPAMFIQVIQGQIGDLAALRRQWDRWQGELAAGAEGWLGTTAGVTGQDRFIAVVRFESEQAARRNSDRPEQGQWWAETAKSLSGEVSFRDSVQADAFLGGGSDGAGFVQVVQGQATDAERLRRAEAELVKALPTGRPDIIGGTVAWHDGGGFTETVYFTSEEDARQGERSEPPAEVRHLLDEWTALATDLRYFDLHEPWLSSP